MKKASVILAAVWLAALLMTCSSYSNFADDFFVTFGEQNTKIIDGGVQLGLTNQTGSGFQSKSSYLYGYIAMKIKLIPGFSQGTVTSYYLTSTHSNHCELDFEFLGNVSGQPYILQTNVFINGVGDREQRITLWFDAAEDFHTYGILWNPSLILFFVDDKVIRLFKNCVDIGVPFLDYQEMGIYSSLWDGSKWATRGGRDPIDWSNAPFLALYKDIDIEACKVDNSSSVPLHDALHQCYSKLYTSPYGSSYNKTVTANMVSDLNWIKENWIVYDYCTDYTRWNVTPPECARNWPQIGSA